MDCPRSLDPRRGLAFETTGETELIPSTTFEDYNDSFSHGFLELALSTASTISKGAIPVEIFTLSPSTST